VSAPGQGDDARDAGYWSAVEEATELLHEERFREAMEELRTVLRADPTNPYAYYFLGIAFFEVGEMEPSRDAYTACLKLAPGHLGARVALCHVLRILGDPRAAIREGLTALSRAPGDPDTLHAIGLAYHAYGDVSAAKKYLEAFLATNPEFEVGLEVRSLLAEIAPPPASGTKAEGDDEED
jgi:tetratricopeptide (TPR) repeat protein